MTPQSDQRMRPRKNDCAIRFSKTDWNVITAPRIKIVVLKLLKCRMDCKTVPSESQKLVGMSSRCQNSKVVLKLLKCQHAQPNNAIQISKTGWNVITVPKIKRVVLKFSKCQHAKQHRKNNIPLNGHITQEIPETPNYILNSDHISKRVAKHKLCNPHSENPLETSWSNFLKMLDSWGSSPGNFENWRKVAKKHLKKHDGSC